MRAPIRVRLELLTASAFHERFCVPRPFEAERTRLFFCRNKKRFHHQALIEVRILEHLRKKDLEANSQHNVIHMLEYFYFRNHLCISFELMR